MKTNLWIRTGIIAVITLIGIYTVFGPRHAWTTNDFTWSGIKQNLGENINLGLDLKGGAHLVMHVKVDDYLKKLTENSREAVTNAAKEAQLPAGAATSIAEPRNYQVTLPVTDASRVQEIIDAVKKKVDFSQWSVSNTNDAITWNLPLTAQRTMGDQALDQAMRIIDSRINSTGVKEPTLARQGAKDAYQILLQMPGVEDPERIKKLLSTESRLELMKVAGDSFQTYPTQQAALQSVGGTLPSNRKIFKLTEREDTPNAANQQNQPEKWLVLEYPPIVDGSEMRDASPVNRGGSNDYQISFSLKPGGAQKMGDWTGKNIGKYLAIVLNDEVKSAPVIKGQIFDTGQIEGRFTKATAEDLTLTLKSGALPAPIEYLEERTVGPSLGADSIRSGVAASLGGLALVVLFMLFYYRGSGVNAVVALVLNILLTIAALVLFRSTLTLPGIAGLILGIGMAVDSNVLIFERIREELRLGFGVKEAVSLGFDRAFITIIDTHITTIISSVILYMYGSGPIRGFAVTLILGLLINLFSAVFVSRTIFMWHLDNKKEVESLSI